MLGLDTHGALQFKAFVSLSAHISLMARLDYCNANTYDLLKYSIMITRCDHVINRPTLRDAQSLPLYSDTYKVAYPSHLFQYCIYPPSDGASRHDRVSVRQFFDNINGCKIKVYTLHQLSGRAIHYHFTSTVLCWCRSLLKEDMTARNDIFVSAKICSA